VGASGRGDGQGVGEGGGQHDPGGRARRAQPVGGADAVAANTYCSCTSKPVQYREVVLTVGNAPRRLLCLGDIGVVNESANHWLLQNLSARR